MLKNRPRKLVQKHAGTTRFEKSKIRDQVMLRTDRFFKVSILDWIVMKNDRFFEKKNFF